MGHNKSSKFANTAKDDNDDEKIFVGSRSPPTGARNQKSYIYFIFQFVSENNLSWP